MFLLQLIWINKIYNKITKIINIKHLNWLKMKIMYKKDVDELKLPVLNIILFQKKNNWKFKSLKTDIYIYIYIYDAYYI